MFKEHCKECEQCARFNEAKTATLALLCLEGSRLWKDENETKPKREPIIRPEHYATKAQVKAAMKYK